METSTLEKLKINKQTPSSSVSFFTLKRLIWAAAVLLLLVVLIIFSGQQGRVVEATTVVQVYPTQSFTLLNASGYLVAQRKAAVASKVTGRLEWLGVEEGSRVKTGQVLARLENRDLDASMEQAGSALQTARSNLEQVQAELDDATRSYERQKELLKQGIVSKSDFDAAETRFRRAVASVSGAKSSVLSASAALKGSRVAYDYSLIRAPFNGVVLTKNADVGDIITPLGAAANAKAAVVTMADLSSLEVEADVAESSLGLVKPGQHCEIILDALPGSRLRGIVHTVVPTADRSKASVLVKVRFVDHDPRLLPEMSAKVAFLSREAAKEDQQPRLAINPAAISGRGSDQHVYRIVNGRAKATKIKTAAVLGDLVEVSGVNAGDRLVLKPADSLRDNSRIKVADR